MLSNIPKDSIMLLGFINMKLRDFYKNLDELCDDMELDKEELLEKLAEINYHYDAEHNKFS